MGCSQSLGGLLGQQPLLGLPGGDLDGVSWIPPHVIYGLDHLGILRTQLPVWFMQ